MDRSIDDRLNDEPAAPEAVQQEAQTEAAEPETIGQPRDESGRFASKEETGAETPQATAEPVSPTEQKAELRPEEHPALIGERRRRQEAEARAAELEARWLQMQQQQKAQPEAPVDFWDNPQGAIATQVQQAVMQALQAEKQQQTMARINESEVKAKATYADYDDAFRAFQQAAQANPSLIQQMTSAGDPAEFAYKKGKTALDLERVGSIDELLANAKAQWEQEARAAMPAPTATLPSTTATDGSVGGRGGPAWAGPKSLEEHLR
jgi:hypothetical protein